MQHFGLQGKRVVVAGAAGKIGLAAAKLCADAGAEVMGLDIVEAPSAIFPIRRVDLANAEAVAEIATELDHEVQGFDVWINAAYPRTPGWGVGPPKESARLWRDNVDIQLTSTCVLADAACSAMARRGSGGALINVSSIYGLVSPDFSIYDGTPHMTPGAYAAVKGGISNHTRYLAGFYGRYGVRVNAVAPGGISAEQDPRFVSAYENRTALGRMADAQEIAGPIVFLASPAASYITGVVLPVDGGWTAY